MKKPILYLCFVIIVLGSLVFMSYTNIKEVNYSSIAKKINNKVLYPEGSPGNYTGSPGDGGATCTLCHSSGANYSLVPSITTNIPVTGYELGVTYEITVDGSSASGASGWGFELTAEKDLDNSNIGSFNLTGATGSLKLILSGNSVTQSNDNFNSWSFNWTAPATNEGAVTFYAAVLAADGDGTSGDQTVTTSLSVNYSTLSISDQNMLVFDIYPNPSPDFLTILLPNKIATGFIELFDYSGKSVKSKQINSINNKLDMSNLSQGLYFIKLNSEGKTGVQKVIKK